MNPAVSPPVAASFMNALQTHPYMRPENPRDVTAAVGEELMRINKELRAAFGMTVDDLILKQ
jgi:hypothetical protein